VSKEDYSLKKIQELVVQLRTMISIGDHPPIEDVIKTGIYPYLIDFLGDLFRPYPTIMSETLWIFNNIIAMSNDEYMQSIKGSELKNYLVKMLEEKNSDILENVRPFLTLRLFGVYSI
jgi:hypothetical protein